MLKCGEKGKEKAAGNLTKYAAAVNNYWLQRQLTDDGFLNGS